MNTEPERNARADVIEATRIETALQMIGLDDPSWAAARPLKITRYWSGEEAPAGRHSEARLLWSSAGLSVRFVCRQEEPLIVSREPKVERKTLGLWDRDVCEIFVSPDPKRPERYLEFEAAPTGEWLDLAIEKTPDSRETDWEFHSGMKAFARINADNVMIAMSIPWEAFGGRPETGTLWRGNLTRCVGDGDTRGYLAWRPTYAEQPDFHVPEVFGEIVFTA